MWISRTIEHKLRLFRDKLVVLYGPRQSGKTSLIVKQYSPDISLNLDISRDRLAFKNLPEHLENWHATQWPLLKTKSSNKKPAVFIDEIHKGRGWRNLIKGTYDKFSAKFDFVVSGSSAFELRKQDKGDSLAGRAVWLELYPVTFSEYFASVNKTEAPTPWNKSEKLVDYFSALLTLSAQSKKAWKNYVAFGSFAENLVKKNNTFLEQWLKDYMAAMLDRDLRDLNGAKDVERVYQVFELLMEGLGSTYSLRSMAETLQTSPNTIKSDIHALRQVLWGFEINAFASSRTRQIQRDKKFYPTDFCFLQYTHPQSEGAFLECLVACALARSLKGPGRNPMNRYGLSYYRDYEKREVDFLITHNKKALLAVECKQSPKKEIGNIKLINKLIAPTEIVMVVEEPGYFEVRTNYLVIGADLFCLAMG